MLARLNYQVGAMSLTGFEPPTPPPPREEQVEKSKKWKCSPPLKKGETLGVGNPARHSAVACKHDVTHTDGEPPPLSAHAILR